MLAELTHRCPLRCPYCSNPVELARARDELDTATWARVFREAADLGVLHVHLSGGEPLLRGDVEALARAAADAGLYVNLITSGVGLDEARARALAHAGVEHVQISLQDVDPARGDAVAGHRGAHAKKLTAARAAREAGLALTVNWVVHRGNAGAAEDVVALAHALGAARLEVAHAQLHGWGLVNRGALVPTRDQVDHVQRVVEEARARLLGVMRIDAVIPEVWARRPKACMGGWGRQFLVIDPTGRVLPCHAAPTIPGLVFDSVRERPLGAIWEGSTAFARFRGTAWMPEPCRSCDRREVDWAGCRCQALAVAGDAAAIDPACELAPAHAAFRQIGLDGRERPRTYVFRGR
jgi:pyrroloquinoline quinone biosynthesis protein E